MSNVPCTCMKMYYAVGDSEGDGTLKYSIAQRQSYTCSHSTPTHGVQIDEIVCVNLNILALYAWGLQFSNIHGLWQVSWLTHTLQQGIGVSRTFSLRGTIWNLHAVFIIHYLSQHFGFPLILAFLFITYHI